MKIHMNAGGIAETNAYLLLDESTKIAALIDAPNDTIAPLLHIAQTQGYDLKYLLLTHGHWDHTADHQRVTDAFPNAKVLIHPADEPKLLDPVSKKFPLPFKIPPRRPDGYLNEGEHIQVGSLDFQILHTPGHCAGLVCLYCAAENFAFVGDLIMAGSVGRYDLDDGNLTALQSSLRRILKWPNQTLLLSGHGPETTIGNEKNGNPFIHQWNLAE